jgi:hypothetical protein
LLVDWKAASAALLSKGPAKWDPGVDPKRASTQAGGEIVARGATKVLVVTAGSGSSSHRALAHAVLRRIVHRRGVSGISDNRGSSTARTATETADILGEVMEAAHLVATLPVISAEMHDTTANYAPTVAHGPVVATMGRRRHHSRRTIATISISVAANLINGTSTSSWEGASEACSSALEVGEATRGTSPVTRAAPVLAGRERSQDVLSAVEDAARRR